MMYNKPCQIPPVGKHCNDKPMIYFEPETYPQNSKDKYVHIKIPFKNGRILLEDDIVGNYIRKNEKDSKGNPIIEKVESQLEYNKRPVYVKKKPVEKLKVGKVLIKHVDPITGRVTYEVEDNVPSNVLEEYNKEINKEVIKDNEFITYGDMKNLLNKELDRVYSRLTALETTMTRMLRVMHYLQNGVLPPYKDEITLPKPGEHIPDIPANELPPLSEYTPPYTPDQDDPKDPEEPDKTIDVVIKVGDVTTPIYPGEEPETPDNPEIPVEPEEPDIPKPDPVTPIVTHIEIGYPVRVGDIIATPFIISDPDNQWEDKLFLYVKLPNNEHYTPVGQLELTPDPDVDGNKNGIQYWIAEEEGEYYFKLVNYTKEDGTSHDVDEFMVNVLPVDPDNPIPDEDISVINDLLLADPDYKIIQGDTVNYEFIINHPKRFTLQNWIGTFTLSIKEPHELTPIIRGVDFSVSKGKLRANTEITFDKVGEYELTLSSVPTEATPLCSRTWYVSVVEPTLDNIPDEDNPELREIYSN